MRARQKANNSSRTMTKDERIGALRETLVRVWDAPTRVFHWLYLACFVAAWLTRDTLTLDWHVLAGYIALALLVFRCAWGLVGTRHARFREFAAGPRAVIAYLRAMASGNPIHYLGHNPAGGWSIFAMIALGLAIGVTGIATVSGMYGYGPLASAVTPGAAQVLRELHELLAWTLLLVVPVHLAGVAAGSFAGAENLIGSMVTGWKRGDVGEGNVVSHPWIGAVLVALALAAAIVYRAHVNKEMAALKGATAVVPADAKAWSDECGGCHLAYPPVLAPARVWSAMLAPDVDHFGEALDLSAARRSALEKYAAAGAAGHGETWLALQLDGADWKAPYRITDTAFWKERHPEQYFTMWKTRGKAAGKHDCGACHRDAVSGNFAPRAIDLP
jgi:cytochrome b